jgi:hypothetical protein
MKTRILKSLVVACGLLLFSETANADLPDNCIGAIGDFVWQDQNMNGIQESGEPGINDVMVTLRDASGLTLGTTMTVFNGTNDGFYQFTGLCPGQYKVEVENPAGFVATIVNATGPGITTASDSNPNAMMVTLTTDNPSDQSIDFGFVTGIALCPTGVTGGTGSDGPLSFSVDSATGDVHVLYRQSRNLNDNSYGSHAVGWGTKSHTFKNLTGSDRAQFIVTNGQANVVANFVLDYLSAKAGTPSGYASLGPFGGDGSCTVGCAKSNNIPTIIKDWNTSLAKNLNGYFNGISHVPGFCSNGKCTVNGMTGPVNLLVNSPPTDPVNTYNVSDPAFTGWDFTDSYEFTISGAAFGAAGFCGIECITVPFIHNSPAKTGSNLITLGPCPQCETCALAYPFTMTGNPRTSVVFNENEVLRAFSPSQGCIVALGESLKVWYNDEHALVLGVRQVTVKTASSTTSMNYDVSPLNCLDPAKGCSVTDPQIGTTALNGDQAGTDTNTCADPNGCGRPMWPALFITDVTDDPTSKAGDWQFGGTPIPPHAVFGTWKAAVRTIDKTRSPAMITVTPDPDPPKNNWNLNDGDPAPTGAVNEGYGAEIRWDVERLKQDGLLLPASRYRLQVMVHDGDQNKAGGDAGQACVNVRMPEEEPQPQ